METNKHNQESAVNFREIEEVTEKLMKKNPTWLALNTKGVCHREVVEDQQRRRKALVWEPELLA